MPYGPDDTQHVHLLIGGETAVDYADRLALYPQIRFTDCENVSVHLRNCIANAIFERCTVNTVMAPALRGGLAFSDCHLQPTVQQVPSTLYAVTSSLGTRFTNCTVHAPIIDGEAVPQMVDRIGFLEINKSVRHFHLNTALANEILDYFRGKGVVLSEEFIAKLKSHYDSRV